MSKVIDNLLGLTAQETIDKEHLNKVLSNAIHHFDSDNKYQMKISDMAEWRINSWVSNQHGYIKNRTEKLSIDIPVYRFNEKNKYLEKKFITIKKFDNQYPYISTYGLKKELDFMPDIELDNKTFRNNYDDYRQSLKLRNQSLILNLGVDEIEQLQMFSKSNCKHLKFYLNQIFNTYIEIIKKIGLDYFICYRNDMVNENSSPVFKKIIIRSSEGNPFMGIRLNVTNEARLVNEKFYNEHRITVKFDRFEENQLERNNIRFNQSHIPTNPLFYTCISQKYNNRYAIDLLTEYKNPNYYFFIETSKGKIKLNKDIIQSCAEKMMLKYIFNPMFKDSGLEVNSDEELSENFLSYFEMYQLMKY